MPADPLALMHRETQIRHGPVADHVAGVPLAVGRHMIAHGQFLMRETDFSCAYRPGEGLVLALGPQVDHGRMELLLAGTVRTAVACLNGLFPLHASAVAAGGGVIAFTGQSGAGKSTLVAALNQRGVPLFCDDTLVMDLDHAPPLCLPGHKRLKLWPDAASMAGVAMGERVSADYGKHYCTVTGSDMAAALPLAAIVQLDEGPALALERLRGGQALAALADDHYTARLHREALGYAPGERLHWLARLAGAVPVWRFTRPFVAAGFVPMVDFILPRLEGLARR